MIIYQSKETLLKYIESGEPAEIITHLTSESSGVSSSAKYNYSQWFAETSESGDTVWHILAKRGNLELTNAMINFSIRYPYQPTAFFASTPTFGNVDNLDRSNNTPFYYAVTRHSGNIELINSFLKLRAHGQESDRWHKKKSNETREDYLGNPKFKPVFYAVENNLTNVVNVLLQDPIFKKILLEGLFCHREIDNDLPVHQLVESGYADREHHAVQYLYNDHKQAINPFVRIIFEKNNLELLKLLSSAGLQLTAIRLGFYLSRNANIKYTLPKGTYNLNKIGGPLHFAVPGMLFEAALDLVHANETDILDFLKEKGFNPFFKTVNITAANEIDQWRSSECSGSDYGLTQTYTVKVYRPQAAQVNFFPFAIAVNRSSDAHLTWLLSQKPQQAVPEEAQLLTHLNTMRDSQLSTGIIIHNILELAIKNQDVNLYNFWFKPLKNHFYTLFRTPKNLLALSVNLEAVKFLMNDLKCPVEMQCNIPGRGYDFFENVRYDANQKQWYYEDVLVDKMVLKYVVENGHYMEHTLGTKALFNYLTTMSKVERVPVGLIKIDKSVAHKKVSESLANDLKSWAYNERWASERNCTKRVGLWYYERSPSTYAWISPQTESAPAPQKEQLKMKSS